MQKLLKLPEPSRLYWKRYLLIWLEKITHALSISTIGIGAGPHCDGQVLVLYDLLGLFDAFIPKFVKTYAHLKADTLQALTRYKEEVEQGKFPRDSESYH